MKKILLSLSLLIVITGSSQFPLVVVDSSKIRVGKLIIQARDAENLRHLFSTADVYDELLDSLNSKYRKQGTKPQNQDQITIDSVVIGALLGISSYMRQATYDDVGHYYQRIDAAIKAIANPFLQRFIVLMDASAANRVQNIKQDGRRRYLGKQ